MNGGWYVNSVFGCICDCSAGSDGFVANCDVTVALSCIWIGWKLDYRVVI